MKEREMRPAVANWLVENGHVPIYEVSVGTHAADIVSAKFAQRTNKRIPDLESVIGVELKLHDVSGVLRQCSSLRHHCNLTYAAMPATKAKSAKVIKRFEEEGIGLLAVNDAVEIVVPSVYSDGIKPEWRKDQLKRKLWRRLKEYDGRIAARRLELKMSQVQLAKLVGVFPQYICNLEMGRRDYTRIETQMAIKIAQALKTTVASLFDNGQVLTVEKLFGN